MDDTEERELWAQYGEIFRSRDLFSMAAFASRVLTQLCQRRASLRLAAERQHRRRAGEVSPMARTRVFERDGFRCRRCGAGPESARLVIDHVVPIVRGGTGEESNLQTLCEDCNTGKADREPHPHDFLAPSE